MYVYIYIYIYIYTTIHIYKGGFDVAWPTGPLAQGVLAGMVSETLQDKGYYSILYYDMLYYTILYHTTPHYTILYHTILYCSIA